MKRPHILPRGWSRGVTLTGPMPARARWIIEQSTRRWERNHNAGEKMVLPRGELGRVEGVRIITSGGPFSPVFRVRFAEPGEDSFGVVFIHSRP